MTLPQRTRPELDELGALNQPTVGKVDCVVTKLSGAVYRMDFTMKGARIPVTDATTNGSYGTLKLFTFNQGAISFLGSRQDYTAFREGSALTTGNGDAAFEIGIGTTAIGTAADGTLGNGVNENVGQAVSLTLAGSPATAAGTAVDGAKTTALNGTASPVTLNLNWSGTAATIDANSTIDVWGTASITFAWLGDD
jgi:hypothetical protein